MLLTPLSYKVLVPALSSKDINLWVILPAAFISFTFCGKNLKIGLNDNWTSILWGNSLTLLSVNPLLPAASVDWILEAGIPISHVVSLGIVYVKESIIPGFRKNNLP